MMVDISNSMDSVPSKKKGKAIMVLGATSDAGKSVTAMSLCRILSDLGYSVCPFKSQNMSLNAKPTKDGHEISMIQELQCQAARVESSFLVNPILMKPIGDMMSQVIVKGKVFGEYDVQSYYNDFIPNHGFGIVKETIDELKEQFDFIIMEGAGSPAEINIYDKDIANMRAAEAADADCILVVNTEWGGSFAYILGTVMLMPPEDRKRIKAILYNNVRGYPQEIMDGALMLKEKLDIPILGCTEHFDIHIPQEDSEFFRNVNEIGNGKAVIGVIKLPKISNFTDLDPLYGEDVTVRFVSKKEELDGCDAIIIPGTKNTTSDMRWLTETGLADAIREKAGKIPIVGICGGYQILGKKLSDPYSMEDPSIKEINGLGLLDIETKWERRDKITVRNHGIMISNNEEITGYQIHVGTSVINEKPLFRIEDGNEGSCNPEKKIFGTYLHGVFEKPAFRKFFLSLINPELKEKGYGHDYSEDIDKNISKIADIFKNSMDFDLFKKLFMEAEE